MEVKKERKVYTPDQIYNYMRIMPLPHPNYLFLLELPSMKKVLESKSNHWKAKKSKRLYASIFCKTVKLHNNPLMKHRVHEELYSIPDVYRYSIIGQVHARYLEVFHALFEEKLEHVWWENENNYSKGYMRVPIESDGNIAYTTIENAIDIVLEYVETKDIKKYTSKYNYYKIKNRKKEDILVEEYIENLVGKNTGRVITKNGKRKRVVRSSDIKTLDALLERDGKLEFDIEYKELKNKNIMRAINQFIKNEREELKKWSKKMDKLRDSFGDINKQDPDFKVIKRNIDQIRKTIVEIKKVRTLVINDSIVLESKKKPVGRDYHTLTFLSKRTRDRFFKEYLDYTEFDIENEAFNIMVNEFGDVCDIETIKRYAKERDEIFKEGFQANNLSTRSKEAIELKPKLKVEFLAALMGKKRIDMDFFRYNYFDTFFDKIREDSKKLQTYIMEHRKEFEKKYNIGFKKRNCIPNIFMRIESNLMDEIMKLSNNCFRIHDAIYIKTESLKEKKEISKKVKSIAKRYNLKIREVK